ncbi:DUF4136 domain-containing protein [Echinicola sp. CAU 1574]|uniref:DUF4136 domain-containing protein n=1 Tax=Echinicola arenosa TaxID=2774144 RepID=A0ABR9AND2_9BACT|nr:DUF4136 domain-containing protein [Echinicola arenosa]MBD8489378.1 DUF4136 domain-containing protein [Echinicola arenosa]
MLRKLKTNILVASIFMAMGCTPNGAEFVDELDLVLTVEDPDVNYDDYETYYMPDSIVLISNDNNSKLDKVTEQLILVKIDEHFQQMGWEKRVNAETDGSDVVLLVSVIDLVNFQIVGWWDYWGWWPGWGWYGPVYPPGGWYPGYPGGCCYFGGVYSYREGTLIIEMVDPNNATANSDSEPDPLPILWAGGLNGLLEGSQSNLNNRIDRGLDQIFTDSPYLNK